MLVVMEKASPASSTTETWLVPPRSCVASVPNAPCLVLGGDPAATSLCARVRLDQRAALGEIGRVEQARDRNGHEIGIGQIAGAVGESEPLGLGEGVGCAQGEGRGAEVERCQQAERLADRDRARRGRSRAAHAMIAIKRADRLAFLGVIIGEILDCQLARPARIVLHRLGDVGGDGAFVKRLRAVAANDLQRVGERRILQLVTDRPGPALAIEEIGARIGRESRGTDIRQHLGEAERNREAVAGKRNRRLEQLGPGELTVLVVHQLQRREHTGDADR